MSLDRDSSRPTRILPALSGHGPSLHTYKQDEWTFSFSSSSGFPRPTDDIGILPAWGKGDGEEAGVLPGEGGPLPPHQGEAGWLFGIGTDPGDRTSTPSSTSGCSRPQRHPKPPGILRVGFHPSPTAAGEQVEAGSVPRPGRRRPDGYNQERTKAFVRMVGRGKPTTGQRRISSGRGRGAASAAAVVRHPFPERDGSDLEAVLREPAEVVQRRLHRHQAPRPEDPPGTVAGDEAGRAGRGGGESAGHPASPEVPADDGGISAGRDGGFLPAPGSGPAVGVPRPPWIDQWLAWFHPDPARPVPDLEPQGEASPGREDMAARGFLRLLVELCTIPVQDSVLLRQEFPGHPMWDHEIFQRPYYAEFAARLQRQGQATQAQLQAIETQLATTRTELTLAQTKLQRVHARLEDLASVRAVPVPKRQTADQEIGQSSDLASQSYRAAQRCGRPDRHVAFSTDPVYSPSRAIGTVPQLWDEWTAGVEGKPAAQDLERSRRKVIIDELQACIKSGLSPDAAVKEVESQGKHSLYRLSQA
ncbi:hypothetical protein V8E54_014034 [Elaphomyces granulatus]